MTTNREDAVRLLWSVYKQATWGTKLVDGSLTTLCFPMLAANLADQKKNYRSDEGDIGKGVEGATSLILDTCDFKRKVDYLLSAEMAGLILSLALGQSTPAAHDTAWDHTMMMMLPAEAANQLPFTTICQFANGINKYFADVVVADFEISGKIGDWAKLSANLIGSGRADDCELDYPDLAAVNYLRWTGLRFELGEAGKLAIENSRLQDISLKFNGDVQDKERYKAGCGLFGADALFGKNRKIEFSFSLRRDALVDLDAFNAQTELQAVLTFTGAMIGKTQIPYELAITIPRFLYSDIARSFESKDEVVKPTIVPLYDEDSQGFLTAVLTTDVAAYLAAESS